jgi:formyltetrahydrofolate synthetase
MLTLLSSLTAIAIFVVTRNRTRGIDPKKLFEILKEWGEDEAAFNNSMINKMADLEKLIKSISVETDNISRHNLDLVIAVNRYIKTSKERWDSLCDKIGQPELKYNEEDSTKNLTTGTNRQSSLFPHE